MGYFFLAQIDHLCFRSIRLLPSSLKCIQMPIKNVCISNDTLKVVPAFTIKSFPLRESVAALKQTLQRAKNAPLASPKLACLENKDVIKFVKLSCPLTIDSKII